MLDSPREWSTFCLGKVSSSSATNCNYLYKGSVVGQALCDHMDVRKVGFTGSTEVGKGVMKRLALNGH